MATKSNFSTPQKKHSLVLAHSFFLTQFIIDVTLHSAQLHEVLHPAEEIFSLLMVLVPAIDFCKCAQLQVSPCLLFCWVTLSVHPGSLADASCLSCPARIPWGTDTTTQVTKNLSKAPRQLSSGPLLSSFSLCKLTEARGYSCLPEQAMLWDDR